MKKPTVNESTIARMAGNIAAGFLGLLEPSTDTSEAAQAANEVWLREVTFLSVGLARRIAKEVERTEPQETAAHD